MLCVNVKNVLLVGALLGIFVLMYIMLLPARSVESLEGAVLRERVVVSGFVEEERGISTGTAIVVKGIEVRYQGFVSYNGKNVIVEGYVDEFRGKRYVVAQSIMVIS